MIDYVKMFSDLKRKIEKYSPSVVRATITMLYWIFHPYREGVLIIPKRDAWLIVRKDGSRFYVPSSSIGHHAFGLAEPYEHHFKIRNGDIVLDAGACIGGFTVHAARRAKLVIAIEPIPSNIVWLRMNTAHLKNVWIIEKAVWSHKGYLKIHLSNNMGSHSIFGSGEKIIRVEADTLDSIIEQLHINRVDFLKMDIEGAELEALKGANRTLKITKKAAIAVHPAINPSLPSKVRNFLESKGFKTCLERPTFKGGEFFVYAWK